MIILDSELEATDYVLADQILARLYPDDAESPVTLAHTMNTWMYTIAVLETGYNLTIYDYQNDLSDRDILDNLLRHAPAALGTKLTAWLALWDARLLAATRPVERSLLPTLDGTADQGFWWWRAPARFAFAERAAAQMHADWDYYMPGFYTNAPPHAEPGVAA